MAKKVEQKTTMSKVEILDKCIETINYLTIPVAGVAGIWGFDITVYVAACAAVVANILEFVKLFVKK